jgi:hypothetical protein
MSPACKRFPITISMLIITAQPHFLWCGRAEVLSQFQQKYTLFLIKIKVKCTIVQALRLCTCLSAHRGSKDLALPLLDHGTRRGEGSASRPGRFLPPGKNRYPLYRRLGGPQGRSGHIRKTSPAPGFDPRTVQPVASRYTD